MRKRAVDVPRGDPSANYRTSGEPLEHHGPKWRLKDASFLHGRTTLCHVTFYVISGAYIYIM